MCFMLPASDCVTVMTSKPSYDFGVKICYFHRNEHAVGIHVTGALKIQRRFQSNMKRSLYHYFDEGHAMI